MISPKAPKDRPIITILLHDASYLSLLIRNRTIADPNDRGKEDTKYVVGGDIGIGGAPYGLSKEIWSTVNRYSPSNIRTTAIKP